MVALTVSMLGWLACALFRFFVIAWTSYGIYSFFRDKINERKREKYLDECKKRHEKEMEEAKERIAKIAKEQGK